MNPLKSFVIAVAAAMTVLAMAGAGTAPATVLCKTNTTPCSEKYGSGTEVAASLTSGSKVIFDSNNGATASVCSGAGIGGEVVAAGSSSEPVRLSVPTSGLTWSGCYFGTTTLSGPELEVEWIPGSVNGTVKVKGMKELEISMDTSWLGYGPCNYASGNLSSHVGVLTGGASPTLDVSIPLGLTSGPPCTGLVKWTATYALETPTPLYVRES